MLIKTLDIWDHKESIDKGSMMLCITTNASTNNKSKLAVMGRGVALQAKNHYPGLAANLGHKIVIWGHAPYGGLLSQTPMLFSFPVKYHWRDKADLSLIKWSTQVLGTYIRTLAGRNRIILLPRPGCGNGGLDWEDVEPIVSRLPDNVWVVSNE